MSEIQLKTLVQKLCEKIAADCEAGTAPLNDTWWLCDGMTIYEAAKALLDELEDSAKAGEK